MLDDDGLAAPGEIIRPGDIYINKESPVETRGQLKSAAALADMSVLFFFFFIIIIIIIIVHCHLPPLSISSKYRPNRSTFKGPEGESCVVDRVALSSDRNNNLSIKFIIRHTRRPEVKALILACKMLQVFLHAFADHYVFSSATNLVADMVRKVFVEQLFNRRISLFLNVASALI